MSLRSQASGFPPKAPSKKPAFPLSAVPPLPRSKDLFRSCFPPDDRPCDYPIPKGDNPYSLAKRFEYIHKNLHEAERYYRVAIAQRIRVESAVKDLAGVLHQQGRTAEACDLLERHKRLYVESQGKFENLLQSLRTQSRNASFKYLKLWGLPDSATEPEVKAMFTNPNRIHSVFLVREGATQTAVLQFLSLSAARKTVEGFRFPTKYRLESVSLPVETQDPGQSAVFHYYLFDWLPERSCDDDSSRDLENSEDRAEQYLGVALYRCICMD